jgi:transposase-like protein
MRLSSAARPEPCTLPSVLRRSTVAGLQGKAMVFGLLERETGKVRTKGGDFRRTHHLQAEIRSNVTPGSALYTDALKSYDGLESEYAHNVIDHAEAYVDGAVHTNRL